MAPTGHGARVAGQPVLGSPDQLFDAWQRFAALLTDASTRSLLGTAEVVEALLARSALQRAIEDGASIEAADLSLADEQYRRTAGLLLETTRVVLYGADQPVTDWWWRVAELASGRPADRLVDVAQAAQEKRVHPHTVRAAIRDLQLPARRLGRSFLILERDLARWQPRSVGRPSAGTRQTGDEVLAAFNEANTRENWDRAHELAKLLADNPKTARRRLAIALDAVNRGEYELAIRWVAGARAHGLDSRGQAAAAVAASTALLQLRRPADALRELGSLPSSVDPTISVAASAVRIDAWLELEDIDAARAEALSSIDAFSSEPAPHLMAARVEFHGKRPVEALQHIVRFRGQEPDHSEGLMLHGSILGQLGDELEAPNLYDRALDLFRRARPFEGARALTKIGLTVARQGRWRLALRLAQSLRANEDAEGVPAVVRAALRAAEAKDELAAAIDLAERWTAPTTWTRLHRAYMVGLRGEWIAASRLIDEAGRMHPREPLELSMVRATALIAANRISDARELLLRLPLENTPFVALPDLLELKLRAEARDERADRENDEEFLKTLERLTFEPSPVGLLAQSWFESESRRPRTQDEISPSVLMTILGATPTAPAASAAAWDIPHRRVSSQSERVPAVTS